MFSTLQLPTVFLQEELPEEAQIWSLLKALPLTHRRLSRSVDSLPSLEPGIVPGNRMDGSDHKLDLAAVHMTLHGRSIAGIYTSLQIPEAKLCFDCGTITPQSIRMPHLALTHGHMDHAGGVASYLGQRKLLRLGPTTIYAAEDLLPSIQSVVEIWERVQGNPYEVKYQAVRPGEYQELDGKLLLRPYPSVHSIPALGYTLCRTARKLKPEYKDLSGPEIASRRRAGDEVSDPHIEHLVTFTGDSTIEGLLNDPIARSARVIISECSFYGDEDADPALRTNVQHAHAGRHTHIDDIIGNLDQFGCETLVLMHLSRKHTPEEAFAALESRLPAAWKDKVLLFHHGNRAI